MNIIVKSYYEILEDFKNNIDEDDYNIYLNDNSSYFDFKYFLAFYSLPQHIYLLEYFIIEYDDNFADYILDAYEKGIIKLDNVINVSKKFYFKITERYGYFPPLKILKESEQTEEICLKAISYQPENIEFVINQTDKICETVLKLRPSLIFFIKNKDNNFYKTAIEKYGCRLCHIDIQTDEICFTAIKKHSEDFPYIKNKTFELCKFIVDIDIKNLKYLVNNEHIDKILEDLLKNKSIKEIIELMKNLNNNNLANW